MPSDVDTAVELLKAGRVVALPTETVYGLGADASNELAVRQIYAIKGRPLSHPVIVHVGSAEAAWPWAATVPEHARTLAARYWPGPMTLVLRRSALAGDFVTGGQDTVAVRVPSHPVMLEVLRKFGGGVAAPSANRFGHVSPTTAAHVTAELGAEVPLIVDGGPCAVGVESTIVDLTHASPRVLRPGGVTLESLRETLGVEVSMVSQPTDVRAPGTLESHYAPRAGVALVSSDEVGAEVQRHVKNGQRVAVIAPQSTVLTVSGAQRFDVPDDAAGYAREIYALLRALDEQGFEMVVAVRPASTGVGAAVIDRLSRAAAPRGKDESQH